MAQKGWPFENIDTSETEFSLWARNIGEGVVDGKGNELEPFADGSGMTVKVKSGQALIRGHYYESTAQETLTISAADLTNPRIDSVVLRLDPTANTVVLAVLTGTPAASPSAPALTQTDSGVYELRIANVAVAAAAVVISAGNVTDTRTIFSAWTGSIAGSQITGEITQATMNASKQIVTAQSKSAAYTIQASDANTTIRLTGATGYTFTIPDVLTAGQRIDFIQDGSGQITFAGSGITLNSADAKLKTAKQYAAASVVCYGSGVYYLIGNLG